MKLQSLDELELSIGGRPKAKNKKTRIAFYIDKRDHVLLKEYSESVDLPVSEIVRNAVKVFIHQKKN